MSHLVITPLLMPLLFGIVLLLLGGSATAVRRALSVIGTFALLAAAVALLLQVGDGSLIVYRLGNWETPFGIALVADRLAATMVLITSLLAACVVLYAVRGADRAGRYFHVLFQLQLFGLNGAFLTGDLFNLFVFFEVLLIASYGLLLHAGGAPRTRAGLHYVVVNLIGSTLFLFAIGTLYGLLGTLNMADLAVRIARLPAEDLGVLRAAGLLLFVVFALKAALAPLHLWLPGAYGYTSAPVAALFAIMTKVGAYAILRVSSLLFGPGDAPGAGLLDPWLLPLALLTIVFGTLGVLASRRLAQLCAYLVIVSAGTLLTAFGLGGVAAVAAGLYYLAHTTIATAALFLLGDILSQERGVLRDRLVAGPALAQSNLLGGLFLVVALAVAGMPPLSGFIGKFLILKSSGGTPEMYWVMGVILISSLLAIMALARAGARLFFENNEGATTAAATLQPAVLTAPLILTLAGVCMVIFAGPLYDLSLAAAEQLLEPAAYLNAVLPNQEIMNR